jgi:glycosyltransferase involved in cell wall biosynthesis
MIVPLRVGGGTRLKILEGWSLGQAIVTTSIGCEGLDARNGENILVRDGPKAFAQGVLQSVADQELRARLGRAGRKTVEDLYDWSTLGQGLLKEYRTLLASP